MPVVYHKLLLSCDEPFLQVEVVVYLKGGLHGYSGPGFDFNFGVLNFDSQMVNSNYHGSWFSNSNLVRTRSGTWFKMSVGTMISDRWHMSTSWMELHKLKNGLLMKSVQVT